MNRPLLGTRKPANPGSDLSRAALPADPAALLDALLGPRLPARPACAGQAPAFDLHIEGETFAARSARLDRAVQVCRRCPALAACTALISTLPRHQLDATVWAGTYPGAPQRDTQPDPDTTHGDPMTSTTTRPRRRLADLMTTALTDWAAEALAAFHGADADQAAMGREFVAAEIERITANADPRGATPAMSYGWRWTDAERERQTARSLVVVAHVLRRDGSPGLELGQWRVRDLLTADGTPVDTLATLRDLQEQLALAAVPDDARALYGPEGGR